MDIHYSRKYLRKETFANIEVLWLSTKVLFVKFGGVGFFGGTVGGTSEHSVKVFSLKSFFFFFFHQFAKFLTACIYLYSPLLQCQSSSGSVDKSI